MGFNYYSTTDTVENCESCGETHEDIRVYIQDPPGIAGITCPNTGEQVQP